MKKVFLFCLNLQPHPNPAKNERQSRNFVCLPHRGRLGRLGQEVSRGQDVGKQCRPWQRFGLLRHPQGSHLRVLPFVSYLVIHKGRHTFKPLV